MRRIEDGIDGENLKIFFAEQRLTDGVTPPLTMDNFFTDKEGRVTNFMVQKHEIMELPRSIRKFDHLQTIQINGIHEFPEWIRDIPSLRFLSISDGNFFEIPTWIHELYHLQLLAISNSKIDYLPPEIANLPSLKKLYIKISNIEEIPNEICDMKVLQDLEITYSNLSDLPEDLYRMKSLQKLDLTNNNFQGIPTAISELKHLKILNLGNDKLHYKHPKSHINHNKIAYVPEFLGDLRDLITLDLSENPLPEFPDLLYNLQNVEKLYLRDTGLYEIRPKIGLLSKLRILDISQNQIPDLTPLSVFHKTLVELRANNNVIRNVPDDFGTFEKLVILDLSFNEITDLMWLPAQNSLRTLYINNNLIKAIPNSFEEMKFDRLDLSYNYLRVLPEWLSEKQDLPGFRLNPQLDVNNDMVKI